MRRWFEFGNDSANPVGGKWSLQSNRNSRKEHGIYPPAFVSMPHKDDLFSVLNASSSGAANVAFFFYKSGDQGTDPAPDCSALHVPRNYVQSGGGNVAITANSQLWVGFPIFDENGDFTGSYSSPVLQFSLEPPDEDGA